MTTTNPDASIPSPYLYVEVHRTRYGSPSPPPPPADPFYYTDGHHWVYYPGSDVYYCDAHHHYIEHSGGRWVPTTTVVHAQGEHYDVEYNGPQPYIYVEVHRKRRR